jgi:hypothetical protein
MHSLQSIYIHINILSAFVKRSGFPLLFEHVLSVQYVNLSRVPYMCRWWPWYARCRKSFLPCPPLWRILWGST